MADRFVAIQVGAVSFIDEGVVAVLDTCQRLAGVNALFLATPTWTLGTGGHLQGWQQDAGTAPDEQHGRRGISPCHSFLPLFSCRHTNGDDPPPRRRGRAENHRGRSRKREISRIFSPWSSARSPRLGGAIG